MGPPVSDCFVVITILQDKGPFFYGLWRLHKKFYTMNLNYWYYKPFLNIYPLERDILKD